MKGRKRHRRWSRVGWYRSRNGKRKTIIIISISIIGGMVCLWNVRLQGGSHIGVRKRQ
jgi:hypothetical protein